MGRQTKGSDTKLDFTHAFEAFVNTFHGVNMASFRNGLVNAGIKDSEFLTGKARLGRITPPPPTVFQEGTGKVMNTIPPNDFSYYEVPQRSGAAGAATSPDPELMGPLAAIGIVKASGSRRTSG